MPIGQFGYQNHNNMDTLGNFRLFGDRPHSEATLGWTLRGRVPKLSTVCDNARSVLFEDLPGMHTSYDIRSLLCCLNLNSAGLV